MKMTAAVALLTLAIMATASADWCMDAEETIEVLFEHEEQLVLSGLRSASARDLNRVTIWVNPESRTWTILESRGDDEFCVLGFGYDMDTPKRHRK